MIRLRLGTSQERKSLIVEPASTPMTVLNDEEVILDGATVSLNGIPLTYKDLNTTFTELGVEDSATLSVVVKTENA